MQIANCIFR